MYGIFTYIYSEMTQMYIYIYHTWSPWAMGRPKNENHYMVHPVISDVISDLHMELVNLEGYQVPSVAYDSYIMSPFSGKILSFRNEL